MDIVEELRNISDTGASPEIIDLAIEEITKLRKGEARYPVLNGILTEELESGAYFAKQDGKWWLLTECGDTIAYGDKISDLLTNLIFTRG